ncbi:MAG: peptide deformylase [Clostridia bacterium]|nr:peptide deformylase [Clostridia bacterium]
MAIRNIVQVGDPVLRKKSFEVVDFGAKTKELLDDMKETLIKADGAGLAAPQVGVLRRVFITYIDGVFKEYINPQIISFSGKQVGEEGCLSVKGKFGTVERPLKVTIKAQDRNGNFFTNVAEGFEAKAIFHENDHLDGILYIDKAKNIGED